MTARTINILSSSTSGGHNNYSTEFMLMSCKTTSIYWTYWEGIFSPEKGKNKGWEGIKMETILMLRRPMMMVRRPTQPATGLGISVCQFTRVSPNGRTDEWYICLFTPFCLLWWCHITVWNDKCENIYMSSPQQIYRFVCVSL